MAQFLYCHIVDRKQERRVGNEREIWRKRVLIAALEETLDEVAG
jgi:hypothetical protein